jgi:hypothetical protein
MPATSPYTAPPGPYAAPAASPPPAYGSPVGPLPGIAPPYSAPTTGPPPFAAGPSAAPPYTPPPYPATPVPSYSPSAVGPPPPFDPYGSGSLSAPSLPAAPYTYSPPPANTAIPPSAPYDYQPPPYDITPGGESYWAKTQRFLEEVSVEYTFLFGQPGDPSDLQWNRLEFTSTFAYPLFGNIEMPLLVTPGFAFNWLEGPVGGPPAGPDLPPRVYDAYLDFAWYPRWYERFGAELGFRTGVWSDFDNVNSDSVRFLARALGSVATAPNFDILLGVVYLDRVDVKILPAGGVYYRPTPEWDLYLVFPNPKVRKFLGAVGNTKWFGYAAGEYGGGSWTVARQAIDDRIDYNDIRVIGGLEWETQSQIRGHIEAGFVFDREVVFVSGNPPNFKPDETFMLRAGVDF